MKKTIYALITVLTLNFIIFLTSTSTVTTDKYSMDLLSMVNTLSTKLDNIETKLNENDVDKINNYPTISPIKHDDFKKISSEFGWRIHPIYKIELFHNGVDIVADYKTNVYSTINGKVKQIRLSTFGYGNKVVISNGNFEIVYAHLGDIFVKENENINKGELIGNVGNTGTITGIHLHYEIYHNKKMVNPLKYFHNYYDYNVLVNNNENLNDDENTN